MSLSPAFAIEADSPSYHNRGAQWRDSGYEAFLKEAHPLIKSEEKVALKSAKKEHGADEHKNDFRQYALSKGASEEEILGLTQCEALFDPKNQPQYKKVSDESKTITEYTDKIGKALLEIETKSGVANDRHSFTPEGIKGIFEVADQIISKTFSDDILFFIGRSPLWFQKAMETRNEERSCKLIPFSGGSKVAAVIQEREKNEEYNFTIAQLQHYSDYLRSLGINVDLLKNPKRKIILIDRWESGLSLMVFSTILQSLLKLPAERIRILALIETEFSVCAEKDLMDSIGIDHIYIPKEALKETVLKHDLTQSCALSSSFYLRDWHN